MEQVQTQAPKIKTILDFSNEFYQELLGYKLEQTSLQQIPENKWNEFAEQIGLNPNSSGIYLPRNQTALVQIENPLSLFHEYFGHGLCCEQSLLGRKLVDLEKRLLEEEKQEFSSGRFTLKDVQRFRQQNQTFQELDKFRKRNLSQYELFAIWTEYLLSGEHNLREDFERKYNSLKKENRQIVEGVINFSEQFGNLATFYVQGMARRTTTKRVGGLLEDIYKDKLRGVKFALLYGSRKEFSDIDIFVVSETLPETQSWLDVRVYSIEDFERRLNLFDLAVTNPIMTGKFILGDKVYFEKAKQRCSYQQISKQAIEYNLEQSQKQMRFALNFPENSKENTHGLDYSRTYLRNALSLKSGIRLFKKDDLLKYFKQASAECDKPLQLKGGKKNATT